ncbi:MAG: hypothetical protein ACYTG6_07830 [Planctomycetota bacterium]|jgi:hypothetical protein
MLHRVLLLLAVLGLAHCGGKDESVEEPRGGPSESAALPAGPAAQYWLDVERTVEVSEAARGAELGPQMLADLTPEAYRLRLGEDGSFDLNIGEGSVMPVVITGTWEPTEEGVAITMTMLNGEATDPEQRITESLRRDGVHLVFVQGDLHLHFRRRAP